MVTGLTKYFTKEAQTSSMCLPHQRCWWQLRDWSWRLGAHPLCSEVRTCWWFHYLASWLPATSSRFLLTYILSLVSLLYWIVFVRSLHTHYISRRLHFFQSFPDNWPSQATKLLALSRQSLSSLKEDKICALTKFGKNEDKNQTSRNSTRVQVEADGRFQPPVFPRDHFVDRNTLQCVLKRSSLYE